VMAGLVAIGGSSMLAQAPATEIYLASLTWNGAKVTVGRPVNITNNPGYDNQPQFLADSSGLLFASNRDGAQTDIYRYDIGPKKIVQVISTPDNEYSPTLTPDGVTFTTVRGDAQVLWRFGLDGSDAGLAWAHTGLIGYHVWISQAQFAAFILGEQRQPNTLQLIDLRTGASTVVERGIGRSLLIRPGHGTVSFVLKPQGAPWQIEELDPKTGTVTALTPTLDGSEDLAWTPDGAIVMGQKSSLFIWRPGAAGWTSIADLGKQGVQNITRLAVSPDGKWLAIVGQASAR
jgi:hypothetical protein